MPLRMLVRAAPFVLGAVAVAIWLRRRRRAAAAGRTPTAAARRVAPAAAVRPPTGRFVREPIDIVTVVDDLLLAAAR